MRRLLHYFYAILTDPHAEELLVDGSQPFRDAADLVGEVLVVVLHRSRQLIVYLNLVVVEQLGDFRADALQVNLVTVLEFFVISCNFHQFCDVLSVRRDRFEVLVGFMQKLIAHLTDEVVDELQLLFERKLAGDHSSLLKPSTTAVILSKLLAGDDLTDFFDRLVDRRLLQLHDHMLRFHDCSSFDDIIFVRLHLHRSPGSRFCDLSS